MPLYLFIRRGTVQNFCSKKVLKILWIKFTVRKSDITEGMSRSILDLYSWIPSVYKNASIYTKKMLSYVTIQP